MPATIDYPTGLPTPQRSGYEVNHASPLIRTELQSGRARQRRRYTSVPSTATVTFNFTQPQAQVFEGWFRWTLADGTEWFNVTLRTPLGLMPYECRFANMYTGPQLVGVDRWQVQATLEIRDRQTLPSSYSLLPQLVLQSDILDVAINREWPAA